MTDAACVQDVRNFTVKISGPDERLVVGTGVILSTEPLIVTCFHVVEAAGWVPDGTGEAEIRVVFPQRWVEESARSCRARVRSSSRDDDLAILELVGGSPRILPEHVAVVGVAERLERHRFSSYGFRVLGPYTGGLHAQGIILGEVDPPFGRASRADPLQLRSEGVNCGMSGAAVLDLELNLVVGLISETWEAVGSAKDRDTAWAVNLRVLSLAGLDGLIRRTPLPRSTVGLPRFEIAVQQASNARLAPYLGAAPPTVHHWVGRDDLLRELVTDWADSSCRISGLIGFGGEGKSGLARHFVDGLLARRWQPEPDGVLWWSFEQSPSSDEFLAAVLAYLGGDEAVRIWVAAEAKVEAIVALLKRGRYLLVLDGVEILQNSRAEPYGSFRDSMLRLFLTYVAATDHPSYCLVTSRTPLLDLVAYPLYRPREVTGLDDGAGRRLLRRLGVHGPDAEIDQVVAAWDGHALTLSLLATLLVGRYGGDVSRIVEIPPPDGDGSPGRLHKLLLSYEQGLSAVERTFLAVLSASNLPVSCEVLARILGAESREADRQAVAAPFVELPDRDFNVMAAHLVQSGMVRRKMDDGRAVLSLHAVVRRFFLAILHAGGAALVQRVHKLFMAHYLEAAEYLPRHPTLSDLAPLFEAMHHACAAGLHDRAFEIYSNHIQRSTVDNSVRVLTYELGAYRRDLELISELFPEGDLVRQPLVHTAGHCAYILNEVGLAFMTMGELEKALTFFERSIAIADQAGGEDWAAEAASKTHQNVAELHIHRGRLDVAEQRAQRGLELGRQAEAPWRMWRALAYLAWTHHLRGEISRASERFDEAALTQKLHLPNLTTLCGMWGVWHAEHLRSLGEAERARSLTDENLQIACNDNAREDISACHRLLGDLDADAGDHAAARAHFDAALRTGRQSGSCQVLIEALLGRGAWLVERGRFAEAQIDLEEGLALAVRGGYRLFEADLRHAKARLHRCRNEDDGRAEIRLAHEIAQAVGYVGRAEAARELLGHQDAPA